eukprot:6118210-Amphidinium_carterae.1
MLELLTHAGRTGRECMGQVAKGCADRSRASRGDFMAAVGKRQPLQCETSLDSYLNGNTQCLH